MARIAPQSDKAILRIHLRGDIIIRQPILEDRSILARLAALPNPVHHWVK